MSADPSEMWDEEPCDEGVRATALYGAERRQPEAPDRTIQILTHSRMACNRACPRRHYLRYELGLRSISDCLPRRIGSAFHKMIEAESKGENVADVLSALEDHPYDVALVVAMYEGHRRRWAGLELKTVAVEQEFMMDVVNPDTGAATPIWKQAGKMDRIVQLADGRLALMEYKTTSRDFSPGADYWVRLHMDQQLSIYVIAARNAGYDINTVLYDVTRRPALRPLKATPEESRKYTKAGALYSNQRDVDETPEEYAARVTAAIEANPDYYFARIEIARLDADLEDCKAEIWTQQQVIRASQRSGRWYKNPDACFEPFPCDYLSCCANRDLETQTPDGFERLENPHVELSMYSLDGG